MNNNLKYRIISCLFAVIGLTACSDDEPELQPESLSVDKQEVSFTGYSSTLAVKVDATRQWSAVTSDYWITVSPDHYPSEGQHFVANVAITVADNDDGIDREGYVSFFIGDVEKARVVVRQKLKEDGDEPEEEFPITWANLQWNAGTSLTEGGIFEAGCCVFADGITNVLESTTGEDIICQIGYSTANTIPDGDDWTWFDCWFNGDWGDNFYYQGKIDTVLPVGTYYYTFRTRNGSGPWKYAGTNGLWDGSENTSGTFEIIAAVEPPASAQITWASLTDWFSVWNDNGTQLFEATAEVFAEGLTDQDVAPNGIEVQLGISKTDAEPQSDAWTWGDNCWAAYRSGNNWTYQGRVTLTEKGSYYYIVRARYGEDAEWVYGGSGGVWNGDDSVAKTFTWE